MFDPHGFAPQSACSSADRPQAGVNPINIPMTMTTSTHPQVSSRSPYGPSGPTSLQHQPDHLLDHQYRRQNPIPHAHNTRIHHQPSHGEGLGPHGTLATHQASLPHGHTLPASHQRLNPHQLPHGQAQARPQQPNLLTSRLSASNLSRSRPISTDQQMNQRHPHQQSHLIPSHSPISDRQTLQLLSSPVTPSHLLPSHSTGSNSSAHRPISVQHGNQSYPHQQLHLVPPLLTVSNRQAGQPISAQLLNQRAHHEQSSLLSSQSTGSFNPAPIDLPTSPSATCQALVNSNHTSLAPRQPGAVNSAPSTTSAPSQPQPVSKSRKRPEPGNIRVATLPNLHAEVQRAILANQKEAQSKAKKAAKASARTAAKKDAARIEAAPNQSTPHEANRQQDSPGASRLPPALAKAGPPTQIDTPLPPLEDELDFSSFDPPLPPQPEPPAHHDAELNDSMIDTQASVLLKPMGDEDDWDNVQDDQQNTSDHVALPAVGKGKREKLPDDILRRLETMELDELRSRCLKHGQYQRPLAEEKVELDDAYDEYLKTIHRIACKHLLKTQAVLGYLGQCNRARGSNMYNNFCRYDMGARKLNADKTLSAGQRSRQLGLLWKTLDEASQLKFKDPAFLATLPNPFTQLETEDAPPDSVNATAPVTGRIPPRKLAKPSKFDPVAWSNKINTDLTNLAKSHTVEGFLVVVHPHKKDYALITRGSPIGEAFLDIMPKTNNPFNHFKDLVVGQLAARKIVGGEVPLPKRARMKKAAKNRIMDCQFDEGDLEKNKTSLREQLGYAIYKASKNVWRNGWPGASTITTLKKLGLVLRVETNSLEVGPDEFCKPISNMQVGETERLLTALGEGKVELVRRDSKKPTQAVGDVRESGDEDDEVTAPVSVKVGKVPPGQGVPKKGGAQPSGLRGKNGRSARATGPAKQKGRIKTNKPKKAVHASDESDEAEETPASSSINDEENSLDNAADFVQPQKPTPRRKSAPDRSDQRRATRKNTKQANQAKIVESNTSNKQLDQSDEAVEDQHDLNTSCITKGKRKRSENNGDDLNRGGGDGQLNQNAGEGSGLKRRPRPNKLQKRTNSPTNNSLSLEEDFFNLQNSSNSNSNNPPNPQPCHQKRRVVQVHIESDEDSD
ncbi:hypothetical protein MJO29_004082 [Puccinia striiformis f. sp. tritici]|nr:hypothetical protein MJO29_004082 [Puccinia striiformis f. sp. tritici]